MSRKEQLRVTIEEERRKLDALLEHGRTLQEAYTQSLLLDRLIEQYLDETLA